MARPHAELAALLSPALRSALARRELVVSPRVRGLQHGLHTSRRVASGDEFLDHRAYAAGDDLRRLDWRASARRDRWVLRRTRAEGNHNLCLLLDGGANMAYGDGHSKFDRLRECAASLAWLAARSNDSIGFAIGGELADAQLPHLAPRGDGEARAQLARSLREHSPGGSSDWPALIEELLARLVSPTLICILSDWLDPFGPGPLDPGSDEVAPRSTQDSPEETLWAQLAQLHAAGHQLVLLQILHGDELTFPWSGDEVLRFVDPRSRRTRREGPGEGLRANYLRRLESYFRELDARCETAGVVRVQVRSDHSPVPPMLEALARLSGDFATPGSARAASGGPAR